MIIDFCHSFKDYNEILDFYGIWDYACPKCGAKHRFHRHARYPRYLTLWDDGVLKEERLDILRLQCGSCKSTHSILTMDMIPFCIYSLQTFLALVGECVSVGSSVPKTADSTGLSFQLLYRFLVIFQEYRERLTLFLRAILLWTDAPQPSPEWISRILLMHPPPWPQAHYFKENASPLFLRRHNTVSYPLIFGSYQP